VVGIGVAVLLHEGSTLVVVANALRLLAFSTGIARRMEPEAEDEPADVSPFRECPDDAEVCPVPGDS
jgi:hypothetical protein